MTVNATIRQIERQLDQVESSIGDAFDGADTVVDTLKVVSEKISTLMSSMASTKDTAVTQMIQIQKLLNRVAQLDKKIHKPTPIFHIQR